MHGHGASKTVTIIAISALPIVELRGAIPVGHLLYPDTERSTRLGRDDLDRSARIFCYAVLGNMLPVPLILLLLGPISSLCMNGPVGQEVLRVALRPHPSQDRRYREVSRPSV